MTSTDKFCEAGPRYIHPCPPRSTRADASCTHRPLYGARDPPLYPSQYDHKRGYLNHENGRGSRPIGRADLAICRMRCVMNMKRPRVRMMREPCREKSNTDRQEMSMYCSVVGRMALGRRTVFDDLPTPAPLLMPRIHVCVATSSIMLSCTWPPYTHCQCSFLTYQNRRGATQTERHCTDRLLLSPK
jgi:hypothetical protein